MIGAFTEINTIDFMKISFITYFIVFNTVLDCFFPKVESPIENKEKLLF